MSSSTDSSGSASATSYPAAGLLSLEASHHASRELLCWSTAARNRIQHIFQSTYDQWRKDWCGSGEIVLGDEGVRVEDSAASQSMSDADARQLLGSVLFGEQSLASDFSAADHPSAPMAQHLIEQAWKAWSSSIEQLLTLKSANTADLDQHRFQDVLAPWSGTLLVTFPWGGGRWAVCLSARATKQILESHGFQEKRAHKQSAVTPGALSSVTDALSPKALPVRIELNPVSLSLGQLQTLAVGDVITLDHRLDEPALVLLGQPAPVSGSSIPVPSPVCAAWLGQRQGQMAVELHPLA